MTNPNSSVPRGLVRDAISIGAVLSGLVVRVSAHSGLTCVVAIVLPSVLLSTTLCVCVFGMSFNIVTLGGMAAAVGLVIVERCRCHGLSI